MLIFPGKNELGQTDQQDHKVTRSEPTTNGNGPRHSLLKIRICYVADSAEVSVNLVIPTAQNAAKDAVNSPIVNDSDGITEKEKQDSLAQISSQE